MSHYDGIAIGIPVVFSRIAPLEARELHHAFLLARVASPMGLSFPRTTAARSLNARVSEQATSGRALAHPLL